MQGHEHDVSGLAFMPTTGDLLFSGSRDATIKIWDTNTGFCLCTLKGHEDWIRGLSIN